MLLPMFHTFALGCAGLFAGAAVYVSLVEHPARLACGTEVAMRQFAPSYARAAVMQASLAILGLLAGLCAWYLSRDLCVLIGSLLLGSLVPYTLIVMMPLNRLILQPPPDATPAARMRLLTRWARLHAVRSIGGIAAFVILLLRSVA